MTPLKDMARITLPIISSSSDPLRTQAIVEELITLNKVRIASLTLQGERVDPVMGFAHLWMIEFIGPIDRLSRLMQYWEFVVLAEDLPGEPLP